MAKVKAPLFGFGASGKLAGALVYFNWKGLNVVREYVIPANPDTIPQQTQRKYLREAVAKVHAAQVRTANPLNGEDISAYALLGSLQPTPRTWFNTIVKLWLNCEVAEKVPVVHSGWIIHVKDADSINLRIHFNEKTASQLADGKFYFGSSKTALINAVEAVVDIGDSAYLNNIDCSAFLTAGKKYFVQFKPDATDPCVGANSGIYYFVAT